MKVFCTVVLATVLCAFRFPAHADLADGIKAIVHDSVITMQEVELYTAQVADELRRQYRNQPEVYEKKLAEMMGENLERLLERQLILHEFTTAGYNLPESVIEEEVQRNTRARFGDRATLSKTLQAQGITYEKYRQRIREQFIIEQMRFKNVQGELIVSPHKIETYYLAHKDEYKVEDEVKLRMIVLNKETGDDARTQKKAEEIVAKIKEGATFTEMAAYSQGRTQDAEWWQRSALRKELADVAFALKPGEVSGIIDTPGALYLMLVEDKRPAHLKSLSEVRDEIEKNMISQERDRLQKQWIERLKKKTFVRYF